MRLLRFAFIPLLLAAPALQAQEPPVPSPRENVWSVSSADPGMDAAIARARETLPIFHGYMPRAQAGEVQLKLKARFAQGDDVEHMWITGVTWDGRVYQGVLESQPLGLTNVRAGQAVTIRPERVSDWMVVERGDVMLGNFTTMELRGRMQPKQRAQLDRQMGYRILADSALITLPRQN